MSRLPRLARTAVVAELGVWRSAGRWVLRRPDVPAGAQAFGYASPVVALYWVFIGVSAVEVVALDLILPWVPARVVAAVLGVWGLVWMVGLLGAVKTCPHLVEDAGLRVRNGFLHDVGVPWAAVASVSRASRDLPSSSRTIQVEEHPAGDVLAVAVAGRTNVLLRLEEPLDLLGDGRSFGGVRLWADEPAALVAAARARVGTAS